jgi:selenium donor protein
VGVDAPDDCAVVRAAPGSNLLGVFSVDFFRSFYDDPYVFGQVREWPSAAVSGWSGALLCIQRLFGTCLYVECVFPFLCFFSVPYPPPQIAATHALSDCHAMGVPAVSALAIAVLPFGLEDKVMRTANKKRERGLVGFVSVGLNAPKVGLPSARQRDNTRPCFGRLHDAPLLKESSSYFSHLVSFQVGDSLLQMMAGACAALAESNCALVGGHTCEGSEMALGFAINGAATDRAATDRAGSASGVLTKGGLAAGQLLVLTQGLGTGVLFAARMRNQAKGPWVSAALQRMCQSSRAAAGLCVQHGAAACTDVTGFGLAGHLAEMCKASGPGVGAELWLGAVPLLAGAKECVAKGIFSSLQPANLRLRRAVDVDERSALARDPAFALLFDPQTSGGLLVALPADHAGALVAALQAAGYDDACVIGEVVARAAGDPDGPSIKLLP